MFLFVLKCVSLTWFRFLCVDLWSIIIIPICWIAFLSSILTPCTEGFVLPHSSWFVSRISFFFFLNKSTVMDSIEYKWSRLLCSPVIIWYAYELQGGWLFHVLVHFLLSNYQCSLFFILILFSLSLNHKLKVILYFKNEPIWTSVSCCSSVSRLELLNLLKAWLSLGLVMREGRWGSMKV